MIGAGLLQYLNQNTQGYREDKAAPNKGRTTELAVLQTSQMDPRKRAREDTQPMQTAIVEPYGRGLSEVHQDVRPLVDIMHLTERCLGDRHEREDDDGEEDEEGEGAVLQSGEFRVESLEIRGISSESSVRDGG